MKIAGLVGLAVVALVGCGTTATIHQRDGTVTEAKIIGSTQEDLYVRTLAGRSRIPRSEVTAINHPGNVSGNIGVGVLLVGLLQAGAGAFSMATSSSGVGAEQAVYLTLGSIPAGAGTLMMVEGYGRHGRSKEAARPRPEAPYQRGRAGVTVWTF